MNLAEAIALFKSSDYSADSEGPIEVEEFFSYLDGFVLLTKSNDGEIGAFDYIVLPNGSVRQTDQMEIDYDHDNIKLSQKNCVRYQYPVELKNQKNSLIRFVEQTN